MGSAIPTGKFFIYNQEPVSKRFILFNFREGENYNRRYTLSIGVLAYLRGL